MKIFTKKIQNSESLKFMDYSTQKSIKFAFTCFGARLNLKTHLFSSRDDNRFTWFTNKLATSTGREGAVLLWRGKNRITK